jgi:anaerobic selenocysteine-containing dehydrogenase
VAKAGATLGGKVGMKVEFFAEAKLILIWGSNSIGSNLHFWRYAQQAKRNGAKLVCIDPRKTETADKCHEHIALRPGTDAALALALMHELIAHDWLDHDYIARHTLGWEQLRERALQWPPERAAEVCGMPAEQIRQLARDYGTTQPAAIRLNYGMQRVRGGGNAVRAVACLPALTGAWRHRAGGCCCPARAVSGAARRAAAARPAGRAHAAHHQHGAPLATTCCARPRPLSGPEGRGPGGLQQQPGGRGARFGKVVQGFAREDLFTVVLEHFQTDTADYADYILPATTQLEHWDVHLAYGHTDVMLNRPAIAPVGQARSNAQIFRDLARAWAFTEPCFADSDEALCRQAFGDAVDFALLETPGLCHAGAARRAVCRRHFPTPVGRCEFFSARLAAQGLDGLPDHVPNHELQGTDARYPLAMISPPARNFLNSTFVNVKACAHRRPPVLEMHPDDAAWRAALPTAAWCACSTTAAATVPRAVSTRARPGVVNGLGIWWRKLGLNGTNVNELTSQALTDLGRFGVFRHSGHRLGRVQRQVGRRQRG